MTGRKLKTKAKAPTETRRLGYARASTYGQTINAQLAQLRAEGCTRIYREKMGGVRPDRRELLKLLKALAPGDVVTGTRIDRLPRPTFHPFAILKQSISLQRRVACEPEFQGRMSPLRPARYPMPWRWIVVLRGPSFRVAVDCFGSRSGRNA